MNMQFPIDIYGIKGVTDDIEAELATALNKLNSEYNIKLDSDFVEEADENDIFITGYHDGVMSMVVNENADFDKLIVEMKKRFNSGYYAGKTWEDVSHILFL